MAGRHTSTFVSVVGGRAYCGRGDEGIRGWRLTLVLSKSVAITNATNIVFTRIMLVGPAEDARQRHISGEAPAAVTTG